LAACQGIIYSVEILWSARRHDIAEEDIIHAWNNAMRLIEFDHDGEEQLLIIGPARSGDLLELVAVPADVPARIIHANRLQPSRNHYLR
jgi:hypothetical protein